MSPRSATRRDLNAGLATSLNTSPLRGWAGTSEWTEKAETLSSTSFSCFSPTLRAWRLLLGVSTFFNVKEAGTPGSSNGNSACKDHLEVMLGVSLPSKERRSELNVQILVC